MRKKQLVTGLCLGIFLLSSSTNLAAKLPEWAAAIAAESAAAQAGEESIDYRVLLSETRVLVQPDGTLRVRQRRAVEIYSERPGHRESDFFHFSDNSAVEVAQGWHLQRGGKVRKSGKTPLNIRAGDSFLTDAKASVVTMGNVGPGSSVFFEFEAVVSVETLAYSRYFYELAGAWHSRFELELPPGWTARYAWLRVDGPEPEISNNLHVWEMNGTQPPESEPMGVSPADAAPLLLVTFSPPAGAAVKAHAIPDWQSLAVWYEDLSAGRDTVTGEVQAIADSIYASTANDLFATIGAAGFYVRDRVRYVAKEIGIGSYQPRPAGQVATQLFGDCKDKGTLFRSLLDAAGIESFPILINATSPGTVSDDIPNINSFNHYIVAVPIPAEAEIPDAYASATIDGGELGSLLIVDTTNEYLPIGTLPAYLSGKKGLLVAGPRSRLLAFPGENASIHRIERQLIARREADGIHVDLAKRRFGEPAIEERAGYRRSSSEYIERARHDLQLSWPDAEIEDYAVDPEMEDGSFVERIRLRLPAGNALPLFRNAHGEFPRVRLRDRMTPVVYPYPITLTFKSTVEGLPEGFLPPPSFQSTGPGWEVSAEYEDDAGVLQATWTATVTQTRFPRDDFDDLKKLWMAMKRGASPAIALGRSN